MADIEISTLKTLSEVTAIAAEISELVGHAGANYSHEPGFLLPWLETAERMGQSLQCIVARDREKLVAFMPLCLKPLPKALFAKRLAPPLIGSSPSFDLVIDPSYRTDDSFERIAMAIAKLPWSFVLLKSILASSCLANDIVPRLERPGFAVHVVHEIPFYTVEGISSSESYWAGMKSRKRIELRRAFGKCQAISEFICLDKPEDVPRIFDLVRSTLGGSWKNSKYLSSVFLPMLEIQFHELCVLGQARARFCVEDGHPIAFLIEFIDRDGTVNAYFNAMDENRKEIYPGIAVLLDALMQSFDTKVRPYKSWATRHYVKKLANDFDEVVTVTVERTAWIHSFRLACLKKLESYRGRPKNLHPNEQVGREIAK